MNEKCWNIGLLHVSSNGVEIFYVKVVLDMRDLTFYLIVDFRKLIAIPLKIDKPPPCFSASYLESF